MSKARTPPSPGPPGARSAESRAGPDFQLAYTEDAAADIARLDGSLRKQLRKDLEKKLAIDPAHRIVYRIYKGDGIVAICAVGPHKQGDAADIYSRLQAVAETGRLAGQVASLLERILPKKK